MFFPARLSHALHLLNRLGAVWIAVILLYLVSGLISPGMFQISETLNILQIAAFLGIVAIGQTLAVGRRYRSLGGRSSHDVQHSCYKPHGGPI